MTDNVAVSNDEKAISLFQLDVLVGDPFALTFGARDSVGPEKRLILAVLEEAIHCFQKYMSAARFTCRKYLAKKIGSMVKLEAATRARLEGKNERTLSQLSRFMSCQFH